MGRMSEEPNPPAEQVERETPEEHDHAAEGQVPDQSVDKAVEHAHRQDKP